MAKRSFNLLAEEKPLGKTVISLDQGEGRTKLSLVAKQVGDDWVVWVVGGKAHVGAVGIGVYDDVNGRAYSSVITIAGHRDDRIAKEGAERVSKYTGNVTVFVVGIHIQNITEKEISLAIKNSEYLVSRFLEKLKA